MIIIPARLRSTRFPQKILADVCGLPMLIATAKNAQKVDEVVIACDDSSVSEICKKHGIKSVMTDPSHASGTDRCAEAADVLGLKNDEIIINVQADEPFLETEVMSLLKQKTPQSTFMSTCVKITDASLTPDVNLVKVVLNKNNEAIYFSRLPIPYRRDESDLNRPACPYYAHIGIYGFFAQTLREFCRLEKSPLEEIEKLEQLRALWHGKTIEALVVKSESFGIDTPQDLENALKKFAQSPTSQTQSPYSPESR